MNCQNPCPEMLRIGSILSDLCVMSACSTFCKLFFGPVLSRIHLQFREKSAQKMGSATGFRRGSWSFSVPLPACLGRCSIPSHRPRTAPALRGPIWRTGGRCAPCRGRCTLLKWRLRRHLPPRPNWWRRSWRLAPVAPPAPAPPVLSI